MTPKNNESTSKKFDRLFAYNDEMRGEMTELKVAIARVEERLANRGEDRRSRRVMWGSIGAAMLMGLSAIVVEIIRLFKK